MNNILRTHNSLPVYKNNIPNEGQCKRNKNCYTQPNTVSKRVAAQHLKKIKIPQLTRVSPPRLTILNSSSSSKNIFHFSMLLFMGRASLRIEWREEN